jgi:glycolate oxidase
MATAAGTAPPERERLTGAPDRAHLLAGLTVRTLDGPGRAALVADLRAVVAADRVLSGRGERLAYGYDATSERWLPDAVAFPLTAEEAAAAVRVAARHGVAVVARGAASGLSGGAVPVAGGVVLAMTRMDRLLGVDTARRTADVEPGLVNRTLSDRIAGTGLAYAPDPASYRVSTLGGNVAENSGGPHCVLYGVTSQHVERLEVVTAEGERLVLPHARDRAEGVPDLTGILVGSEGTLAVITRITVRLVPQAAGQDTLLAAFADPEAACAAVSRVVAAGLLPSTLELLDGTSTAMVERSAHAGYPDGAGAVILMEVEGEASDRAHQAAAAERLLRQAGALEVRVATDAAQRDALWAGRRAHYGAMARVASHLWVQDVTVPRPRLAAMIREVEAIARRHRLPIATVAHAGDGNLHPDIPYDPQDPDQVSRMRAADREILEACVALGGSITGEHGVGIDKLEAMALMYTEAELAAMTAVKRAFDPAERLNPVKAVLSPGAARRAGRTPRRPPPPSDAERAALEALRQARIAAAGRRALPVGGGRRAALAFPGQSVHPFVADPAGEGAIRVDAENLTVEVAAGTAPAALAAALDRAGLMLRTPPDGSTVGGYLARDPFRPHRATGLSARDAVLALTVVTGPTPDLCRFGRATTKNVAGYDMPRLWVGSWGRFGPIVSAVLRLWPRRETALWRRSGALAEVLDGADRLLSAPAAAALREMAVVPDPDGAAQAWVRAELPAAGALAAAGFARVTERDGDPLAELPAALEAAEIRAARGEAAILYAHGLPPRIETERLAEAARMAAGSPVWALPGARVAVCVDAAEPTGAARAWLDGVRAVGGEAWLSSGGEPWRGIAPSPPSAWLRLATALERTLAEGEAAS